MALTLEHKGRTVDLRKPWIEMSPEERQILEDRAAAGENYRRELIRFGYLSEDERRRLISTYPDLRSRFEPRPDLLHHFNQTIGIYVVFIMGIIIAGGHSPWPYVIGTIAYWSIAGWVLYKMEKLKGDKNELYWEWRGYKCNRHGGKLDESN